MTIDNETILKVAQEIYDYDFSVSAPRERLLTFAHRIAAMQRDEWAAKIKAEDDYCVTEGDYILDSDDCIRVINGTWVRPDYSLGD